MATRKSTRKRHDDRVTEEDVKAALDVLWKDYYQDVRGIGDDLIRQIKEGEISDRDAFETALHQDVDGSQRVIYTIQSQVGLICSRNDNAYVDEFGEVPVEGDSINWAALMFAALERDVRDYIERSDEVDLDALENS